VVFVLLDGVRHWESFQVKGPIVWCEVQLDYTFGDSGKSEVERGKGGQEAQVHKPLGEGHGG
jgi:hypothetical protein